jgi:membrane-bound metal-dependent hydrolase YbcI (DUF457 family)
MFIGHFAVGFAARKVAPRGSLAAYLAAAQLPDILWPMLVLAGVERVTIAPGDTVFTPLRFDSYPVSHSLALDVVWGVLLGSVLWRATRSGRAAWICAALVVSHWALDFVSHRADMPLVPGGARYGMALWNSVPATLVTESLMFAIGVGMYRRATRPIDGIGKHGLTGLVALLVVAYLGAAFGPPPPSVRALALTSIAGAVLFLGLALWVDRHRVGWGHAGS